MFCWHVKNIECKSIREVVMCSSSSCIDSIFHFWNCAFTMLSISKNIYIHNKIRTNIQEYLMRQSVPPLNPSWLDCFPDSRKTTIKFFTPFNNHSCYETSEGDQIKCHNAKNICRDFKKLLKCVQIRPAENCQEYLMQQSNPSCIDCSTDSRASNHQTSNFYLPLCRFSHKI